MSESVVTQWHDEGEDDDEDDLPMEDTIRIMREVACGAKPYRPDTRAAAKFRARVQREAEQMKAKGQQLHIPSDWV